MEADSKLIRDASQSDELAEVIILARGGSAEALGQLVESCQAYLLLVASHEMGGKMLGKVRPSDLVQSALVQVQKNIDKFRGQSRQELLAWLRTILLNEINTAHRRFTTQKRDVQREVTATESGAKPVSAIADRRPSPSAEASLSEEAQVLRRLLGGLPSDYREVVVLRNWEQLSFAEVAGRMRRSEDAVKKLWGRAMKRLQKELGDEQR